MKVVNIHERVARCTREQAHEIVATYGTLTDRRFPYDLWPNMYQEGPPGPTAVGSVFSRGAAHHMPTRTLTATLLGLFVMRPLHDAVVQDSFDKLERELGQTPKPRSWSVWVRLLRWVKRRSSPEYQRLCLEQIRR